MTFHKIKSKHKLPEYFVTINDKKMIIFMPYDIYFAVVQNQILLIIFDSIKNRKLQLFSISKYITIQSFNVDNWGANCSITRKSNLKIALNYVSVDLNTNLNFKIKINSIFKLQAQNLIILFIVLSQFLCVASWLQQGGNKLLKYIFLLTLSKSICKKKRVSAFCILCL